MSANRLKLNADKTELLWAWSRHGPDMLDSEGLSLWLKTPDGCSEWSGPCPRRDNDVRPVSRQARCLGDVLLLASSARRVRRSLDAESATTLVHGFVTSRMDYCNTILAGASKSITDYLQGVKYDRSVLMPYTTSLYISKQMKITSATILHSYKLL